MIFWISSGVFCVFLLFTFMVEWAAKQKEKEIDAETNRKIRALAQVADRKYRRKYGRPSTELNVHYPELKDEDK